MKELFLLRGVPGSGKSTLAKSMRIHEHYEADMFFQRSTGYEFDASRLKDAHEWCRDMVMMAMKRGESKIVVSNTFTQEWEMDAYYSLAKDFGYQVFSLIVENRHNGKNIHGCPDDKIEQMKNRFDIKL
jgi:predicted kinase